MSGAVSVWAANKSVAPSGPAINLLRTRLQASGSSGHPQTYTGFWDVTHKTLAREGWPGLYKGLLPTLAKVAPAVSISYVVSWPRWEDSLTGVLMLFMSRLQVYEHSKRALGIY